MEKKDKEKIISEEIKKYKKIFANIPANKKPFAEKLQNQCAFMIATLEELNEIINLNGGVIVRENGNGIETLNDIYLKSYNATIKSFNATIKQLIDLLPEEEKKENKVQLGIPAPPMVTR